MTSQHELDSLLGAFLAEGPAQVADRVIDAALVQIDQTKQRRALRMPWRFQHMNSLSRVAAAAVIGVLVVGAGLYITRPTPPPVGGPSPTPSASAGPSQPTGVIPSPTPGISPALSETPVAQQRAGSWTLTGSMATPRVGHTAALLHDGRVFVTRDNGQSAELYDPATGTWTPTASSASFLGGMATLLRNGKVLVAGGGNDGKSAELYDPDTGLWTTTGSTVGGHGKGTATLLLDGRVLLAGAGTLAELYDPASGTWAATGSMTTWRREHTATLLPDGKVLVAGGTDSSTQFPRASAELYDPATGTWTATGNMLMPHSGQEATALADGRVLVMGYALDPSSAAPTRPCGGHCIVSVVELYDPASGTWTATGTMAVARLDFTATLLSDGTVLAVGGIELSKGDVSNSNLASAERYDPGTGSWTAASRMAVARSGHTATLLLDGTVLVVGGQGFDVLSSAELYDPGSGQ